MNTQILQRFFSRATSEVAALDYFVEQQRQVNTAIRTRAWPSLEQAMQGANLAASMVAEEETERHAVWQELLLELHLDGEATTATVCQAVPAEYAAMLSGACRSLRVAAMRAKLENDAMRSFAGSMASNLAAIINELFPERRGSIYGKCGTIRSGDHQPIVLDTAF